MIRPLVAVLTLVIGSAACVTGAGGVDCGVATVEIDLTLSEGDLSPDPTACRGQEVTLRVSSETDGVLHVHGYDEEIPVIPVAPGEVAERSFEAVRSGQFLIQLHAAGRADATVGILTVHEP